MDQEDCYNNFKEWARKLYTRDEEKIPDIALKTGIDEATLSKWVRDEKWDKWKTSLLTSRVTQLENLYKIVGTLNDKIKNGADVSTKDVDHVLKYTASIKNLETETSVSQIIEVSEQFIRWLRRRDLLLTKQLVVHFDAFINERLAA